MLVFPWQGSLAARHSPSCFGRWPLQGQQKHVDCSCSLVFCRCASIAFVAHAKVALQGWEEEEPPTSQTTEATDRRGEWQFLCSRGRSMPPTWRVECCLSKMQTCQTTAFPLQSQFATSVLLGLASLAALELQDMTTLDHLHEPALLHNLRRRFFSQVPVGARCDCDRRNLQLNARRLRGSLFDSRLWPKPAWHKSYPSKLSTDRIGNTCE